MRAEMASGRLARGDRLPSAKEVAAILDVNLHTVLRAYQSLRDEGLIDLRRGRGAVVTARDPGGLARLRGLIGDVVAAAHHAGVSRAELVRLIESEF